MGFLNLLKQLKKRLKWKRRWLAFAVFVLCVGAIAAAMLSNSKNIKVSPVFYPTQSDQFINMLQKEDGLHDVTKRKIYACGEEMETLGQMTGEQIAKLHEDHPDWEVDWNEDHDVVFRQHINDLSPKCKESAYFGIDEDGNLTLFDGLPSQDQVLRTFFQLDIEYLESSLPKDAVQKLRDGIRITDLEQYNSVLSTFLDYAVDETQKVMRQQSQD